MFHIAKKGAKELSPDIKKCRGFCLSSKHKCIP